MTVRWQISASMPRLFLQNRAEDNWIEDPEGADFPNFKAAGAEALASAQNLRARRIQAGTVIESRRFEITDEGGAVLISVP